MSWKFVMVLSSAREPRLRDMGRTWQPEAPDRLPERGTSSLGRRRSLLLWYAVMGRRSQAGGVDMASLATSASVSSGQHCMATASTCAWCDRALAGKFRRLRRRGGRGASIAPETSAKCGRPRSSHLLAWFPSLPPPRSRQCSRRWAACGRRAAMPRTACEHGYPCRSKARSSGPLSARRGVRTEQETLRASGHAERTAHGRAHLRAREPARPGYCPLMCWLSSCAALAVRGQ